MLILYISPLPFLKAPSYTYAYPLLSRNLHSTIDIELFLFTFKSFLAFHPFFLSCIFFLIFLLKELDIEIFSVNFSLEAIMAVYVVGLLLLLAMADHSDAAYCVCNSGGDSSFQKNIDYACGAGADCSAISQNGACFNPNTARDHCSYAVNSYYQRKGQTSGSCDFAGTATVSPTAPNVASGCVYPSSPSGGSTTPTGGSTTPTGGSTTPTTNPPTFGGTPNSSTGGNTTGAMPGSAFTPGIGIAPTGTGFGNLDGSSALLPHFTTIFILLSFSFALLFSPRI